MKNSTARAVYPYPVLIIQCVPVIVTVVIYAALGLLNSWLGWITLPFVALFAANLVVILTHLANSNQAVVMRAINGQDYAAFLSGNLLFIPSFALSLLRKSARAQYARLNLELKEIEPLSAGDIAPNALLSPLHQMSQPVTLDSLLKQKPFTVLNFGNYT